MPEPRTAYFGSNDVTVTADGGFERDPETETIDEFSTEVEVALENGNR